MLLTAPSLDAVLTTEKTDEAGIAEPDFLAFHIPAAPVEAAFKRGTPVPFAPAS